MEAMVKNSSSDGEWTVVLPSKGKQGRRRKLKPKVQAEEEEQPWKSDDLEIDPQRQARLKLKMEISLKKIESSKCLIGLVITMKCTEALKSTN
ncbi:hypothetical protein ISN45_Aa05g013220 [Arabidopsis thaliana x Arabidopsis arenosa]|uniref:Uncharacterized protein n=1 Tax=Arabidopsis thaliana x Arabidopsis arenosa TaxID=1240361 RepID=A0A8T1ZLZ5_9BRAS|nr:hypothetical protein ISN45_Aa05g013220 [Arabidopsis thaliana x Arabidopsis arenosa]